MGGDLEREKELEWERERCGEKERERDLEWNLRFGSVDVDLWRMRVSFLIMDSRSPGM